jgi:hypothetical protein
MAVVYDPCGFSATHMDFAHAEVTKVSAAISCCDYSRISLSQIRELIDRDAGWQIALELVRIGRAMGMDDEDAVDNANKALEALESHDEFSALVLMAYLCRIAGPLCMHHVCDGNDLYFFHQMSDLLRQKLLEMAELETEGNARARFKEWAAYKSVK